MKEKEGEGVQGGQGLPSKRGSGLEGEWGVEMDLGDEAESRKKLDEQTRKLQKELRQKECQRAGQKMTKENGWRRNMIVS